MQSICSHCTDSCTVLAALNHEHSRAFFFNGFPSINSVLSRFWLRVILTTKLLKLLSCLQSNPGKHAPSWKRWMPSWGSTAGRSEGGWERCDHLFFFVFEWGKTLKEVKPGLFLASNQILMECQEKQQLIKGAKCSSHCSAADVGVFTPDESTSH